MHDSLKVMFRVSSNGDFLRVQKKTRNILYFLIHTILCYTVQIMKHKNIFIHKVEKIIESLPYTVILRSDLTLLGSNNQIMYALNKLIKQKKIVRVGYGIYAKIRISIHIPELLVLQCQGGFSMMTRELLSRLNIPWIQSEAEEEYNLGLTTQIPVRSILRIKKKFSRKISFNNVVFEYRRVV